VQRSLKHAITSIPGNIFDSVNIHITDLHHTSIVKMLLWPKYLLEIIFRYILVCIITYFVRNILIGWWLIHKKLDDTPHVVAGTCNLNYLSYQINFNIHLLKYVDIWHRVACSPAMSHVAPCAHFCGLRKL
jgi:hypothetical protein